MEKNTLDAMIDQFSKDYCGGIESEEKDHLHAIINDSPYLKAQLTASLNEGFLERLAPNQNPNAGAVYSDTFHTMSLNKNTLKHMSMDFEKSDLTFQMGHENQHSFNYGNDLKPGVTSIELAQVNKQIKQIAQSSDPIHNYTQVAQLYLAAKRENEGIAEIGGWNALVSKLTKDGKIKEHDIQSNLDTIYNATVYAPDFIDKVENVYTLKKGLHLEQGMMMDVANKENVNAMEKYYFDKSGEQNHLGKDGNSSYASVYMGRFISHVAEVESSVQHASKSEIVIDLKSIGVTRDEISNAGAVVVNINYNDAQQSKSQNTFKLNEKTDDKDNIITPEKLAEQMTYHHKQYSDTSDPELKQFHLDHARGLYEQIVNLTGGPTPVAPKLELSAEIEKTQSQGMSR